MLPLTLTQRHRCFESVLLDAENNRVHSGVNLDIQGFHCGCCLQPRASAPVLLLWEIDVVLQRQPCPPTFPQMENNLICQYSSLSAIHDLSPKHPVQEFPRGRIAPCNDLMLFPADDRQLTFVSASPECRDFQNPREMAMTFCFLDQCILGNGRDR